MSVESARSFLEKAMHDETIMAEIRKREPEAIPALAGDMGFDATLEELEAAADECCRTAGETPQELAPEEIDVMAGGTLWGGEDAPDGHEMGSALTYHHAGWSKENDMWCSRNFYCASSYLHDKN